MFPATLHTGLVTTWPYSCFYDISSGLIKNLKYIDCAELAKNLWTLIQSIRYTVNSLWIKKMLTVPISWLEWFDSYLILFSFIENLSAYELNVNMARRKLVVSRILDSNEIWKWFVSYHLGYAIHVENLKYK